MQSFQKNAVNMSFLEGVYFLDLGNFKTAIKEKNIPQELNGRNFLTTLLGNGLEAFLIWVFCVFVSILPILISHIRFKIPFFDHKELYYLCVAATCLPLAEVLHKKNMIRNVIFTFAILVSIVLMLIGVGLYVYLIIIENIAPLAYIKKFFIFSMLWSLVCYTTINSLKG